MNNAETNWFLGWLAQADPRVANALPAVAIWQAALMSATVDEAKQAVLDHAQMNDAPATPFAIRRRVQIAQELARAKARAMEPRNTYSNPIAFRSRNPQAWDKLYAQGNQDQHADWKARGRE